MRTFSIAGKLLFLVSRVYMSFLSNEYFLLDPAPKQLSDSAKETIKTLTQASKTMDSRLMLLSLALDHHKS